MYLSDRNTTIASLIFNIFCVKSLLKKMLIHMYGHRRGSGCILTAAIVASGKEEIFFPLVTIAASPRNFRRKQQQKSPSGTQGIWGHAVPEIF